MGPLGCTIGASLPSRWEKTMEPELLTCAPVQAMFYARHRRAVLTVAKFAGMDLAFTNACLCWV